MSTGDHKVSEEVLEKAANVRKLFKDGHLKVEAGHPLSKVKGEMLSEEDEKTLDPMGDPVVTGKPWSKVPTGIYVTVAATTQTLQIDRAYKGRSLDLKNGLILTYVVTLGKPTVRVPTFGASIELPEDLGLDEHKRQYLGEWIAHTTLESINGWGKAISGVEMKGLGMAAQEFFDKSIGEFL